MNLITLSGPAAPSLALSIIEAQRIATPAMTWRELVALWPELWDMNTHGPLMSGWLSDLGHVFSSGVRAGGKIIGAGGIADSVTGMLDAAGHSIEDQIGGDISNEAKSGIARYLGYDSAKNYSPWLLAGGGILALFLVMKIFGGRR